MKAKAPSKNKEIVVDIKPEQWHKAEEEWHQMRESGLSQIGYQNLLPGQIGLWGMFKKDPRSVIGEAVLVITDPNGYMFGDYPYPATILKATESEGHCTFRCLFHPIEEEDWRGDRIEEMNIYRLMPLTGNRPSDPEIAKEVQMTMLLNTINRVRNESLLQMRNQQTQTVAKIESCYKDIKKYQKDLDKLDGALAKEKGNFLTTTDLKRMIDDISSHKKIEWAMLKKDTTVVFQTQMLYATNPSSNKEDKKKPVGRFAIIIYPENGSIYAQNLDYVSHGKGHPNLSGTEICLGNVSTEVRTLIQTGRFYELIDLMILFFSLFPHDSGSPYMNPIEWLSDRENRKSYNPWEVKDYIYKAVQNKEAAERKNKKISTISKAKKATAKMMDTTPKAKAVSELVEPEIAPLHDGEDDGYDDENGYDDEDDDE